MAEPHVHEPALKPSGKRQQSPASMAQALDGRSRILAAAEQVFSAKGFEGCSLRRVAQVADAPLSLATYHFGDKLNLYREVFRARMPELVEQRLAGLALADMETDPSRRLELIVRALLVPMLRLRATERGRRFAVLFAREVNDPASVDRDILREMLAPVTDATLTRLMACFPDQDRAAALWAYGAMIGAMVYMLTGANRLVQASAGAVDPDDVDTCSRQLIVIALAGLRRDELAT